VELDPAPRRPRVRDRKQPTRAGGRPPEPLPGEPWRRTNLRIVAPERLFNRHDLRLDLDHDEDAGLRMERQQVDGPTLPERRIRHLRSGEPALRLEQRCDCGDHTRVPLIADTVDLRASPAHLHHQLGAHRADDPPSRTERDRPSPPVSSRDTSCWLTSALAATSAWRSRCRRRMTPTSLPIATSSIRQRWRPTLTAGSIAAHRRLTRCSRAEDRTVTARGLRDRDRLHREDAPVVADRVQGDVVGHP